MTRRMILGMLAALPSFLRATPRAEAAPPASRGGVVLRDGWIMLDQDR
jgi:hypothetical protein